LLGKGDMLYMPIGYAKPLRVQGAWLSDADAEAILNHYKRQGEPDYIEGVATAVESGTKADQQGQDPLFYDAAIAAITAGQASTSMLQRKFRIGYNHAARIMEELEERGVVGPADGAKPRTILMQIETFKATFSEPKEQSLFDE
ncbi:MAG: DNA translocase FtsK, partial [Firmicutes bacterium]|nr:DNA translocase FtsK [Bacillota bacterium]